MAQISAGTLIFLQAKSKVGKGDIWSFGRQMRVFHCSKLFGQKIFFSKTLFIFASKNSDKSLKVWRNRNYVGKSTYLIHFCCRIRKNIVCKIHIFWEAHKIWRNLSPSQFWSYIVLSNLGGRFLQIIVAFSENLNFNNCKKWN